MENEPGWPLRLLFSILSPLLAVGGFLLVIIEAMLGFGFVVGGVIVFSEHAVLGGALIVCGVGVFLWMIGRGIQAAVGGR